MESNLVVVILTFNSESIIHETITQAKKLTRNVYVVDSGSTDSTLEIAIGLDCEVVDRAFRNYSDQRNWAIAQVEGRFGWQLHLDADEVLDTEAIAAIKEAISSGSALAYLIRRRDYFMGKMLKHSGLNPWHLRLFHSGVGKCENRLYDQHFIASKPALRIKGFMHDKNALTLGDWVNRHNRWADSEALEVLSNDQLKEGVLNAKLTGDSRERTRYFKGVYYRLPSSLRIIAYFIYRYIFRLGFLDGRVGFYFAIFQALWFRALVDAKIYEIKSNKQQN